MTSVNISLPESLRQYDRRTLIATLSPATCTL
jgi:hypothetical protein